MDYNFLPDDEKLWRLQECDFFLKDEQTEEKNTISCTLKNIQNPLLVLFYYNDTEKDVFADWFKASRHDCYQNGSLEDFNKKKDISEEDIEFKFAAVNLDYEKKLDTAFYKVDNYSPFNWIKTKKNYYYPFILFYYKTFPHTAYEGILNSHVINHEFSNWREDFTDIDEKEVKKSLVQDLIIMKDKYYEAVTNKDFFGIKLEKGKLYKITVI
jgi:hypothetical protein